MTTIDVYGKYVVRGNLDLTFENELGFYLDQGGDAPRLFNNGSVTVTNDQSGEAVGASSSYLAQPITVWNRDGATFTVQGVGADASALGFDMETDGLFRNDGTVVVSSEQSSATGLNAYTFDFDFNNTGHYTVTAAQSAYGVSLDYDGSVENSGDITVTGGDSAYGFFFDEEDSFSNTGSVTVQGGSGGAVGVAFDFFNYSFDNQGSIVVTDTDVSIAAIGVSIQSIGVGGPFTMTNSGLIQADDAILETGRDGYSDGVRTILENSGQIVGKVDLGFLNDEIDNSGKIKGDVLLGQGDDAYQETGNARLVGTLYGGIGNDVLTADKGHDVIHGDDGVDGGGDGKDLISGGRGADALFGDGGDDTLVGGAGHDTLTGGFGKDVFLYDSVSDSAPGQSDLIADLHNSDVIDLSAIDADTTQGGDQAFTLVAALDGHAGQAALSYDAGADLTSLSLDVDGDGVADAVITMAGDHRDFTNFVL